MNIARHKMAVIPGDLILDASIPEPTRLLYAALSLSDMVRSKTELARKLEWSLDKLTRHLDALVAAGWVLIEAGGPRGTTYELLLTPHGCGLHKPECPHGCGDSRARGRVFLETSNTESGSLETPVVPNTESSVGVTSRSIKAAPSPREAAAQQIAGDWWERQNPRPLIAFVVVRQRIAEALSRGWPEDMVAAAADTTRGWSVSAFEEALRRASVRVTARGRLDVQRAVAYFNAHRHPKQPSFSAELPETWMVLVNVAAFIDGCPKDTAGRLWAAAVSEFAEDPWYNGTDRRSPVGLADMVGSEGARLKWADRARGRIARIATTPLAAPRTQEQYREELQNRLAREKREGDFIDG